MTFESMNLHFAQKWFQRILLHKLKNNWKIVYLDLLSRTENTQDFYKMCLNGWWIVEFWVRPTLFYFVFHKYILLNEFVPQGQKIISIHSLVILERIKKKCNLCGTRDCWRITLPYFFFWIVKNWYIKTFLSYHSFINSLTLSLVIISSSRS